MTVWLVLALGLGFGFGFGFGSGFGSRFGFGVRVAVDGLPLGEELVALALGALGQRRPIGAQHDVADLRDALVRHLRQVVTEHAERILCNLTWRVKRAVSATLGRHQSATTRGGAPEHIDWSGGWPA